MDQQRPSSLATKAKRYSRAVRRWVVAGRPVRSEGEVERIYQTHCEPCDRFDRNRKLCTICGCRVRSRGMALLNKIRMATEDCPVGKW